MIFFFSQKLAFSDDESPPEKEKKKERHTQKELEKTEQPHQENDVKAWTGRSQSQISRHFGEDEQLSARRFQQKTEVSIVVERAKQRKEEEEKKYQEIKQNAAKKLQDLEERTKSKRDHEEGQGTINPSVVPPQPITPTNIPIPEWGKDKDNRSRNSNDYSEEKQNQNKSMHKDNSFDFKQLTQIEGKNFGRKDTPRGGFERDRERNAREMNGPTFSKQYQNDLPPRFQKQMRNNTSTNSQSPMPFSHQYDNRWMVNNQSSKTSPPQGNRKIRDEVSDKDDDRRDLRRQGSDDSYRSSSRSYSDSGRKSASDNR